jgi:GNAT superfamily N-acetyltransferase
MLISNTIENSISIIVIRPISVSDIVSFVDMINRSWLDTYPNSEIGLDYQTLKKLLEESKTDERISKFQNNIEAGKCSNFFVMLVENKLIGATELILQNISELEYGKIQILYLDPNYIGKGYGRVLMNFAINKLKDLGAKHLVVEVTEYNQRAISFYQKFGFNNAVKIDDFIFLKKYKLPQLRMFKDM